jgi:hypothetical protein
LVVLSSIITGPRQENINGEVAEWSKAAVLKTVEP